MPEETRRILVQIAIYLGIMLFSYIFALIEVNTRAKKKVRAAEERMKAAQQAQAQAEAQFQAAQQALQEKLAEKNQLRLWMDDTRKIRLELDGVLVDTQNLTPEQRQRLIALLTQMRPWLEGRPVASPSAMSPRPSPTPPPTPPMAVSEAPAPVKEVLPPEALTLARQIDAILQQRLAGTPLTARGIRIRDLLSGGVEFVVDGKSYGTVEEIPDPQVQTVIRAAIAAWERGLS